MTNADLSPNADLALRAWELGLNDAIGRRDTPKMRLIMSWAYGAALALPVGESGPFFRLIKRAQAAHDEILER